MDTYCLEITNRIILPDEHPMTEVLLTLVTSSVSQMKFLLNQTIADFFMLGI